MAHDGFVLKHLELHQEVFHFAESVQHGLAILGHRFVIGRFTAVDFRRALAAVEQGHGQLRSDRPEAVRQAEQVFRGTAAVTTVQAQGQVRVIGSLGHTDVGVGGHHRALGRSDVRATLQQLRRQCLRYLRQLRNVLAFRQAEFCRRQADQHGNGVLELGALPDQVDHIGFGAFELCLGLGHRVLARYACAVLVLGHLQRTLISLDRVLEQAFLAIDHAQLQVILHQLRLLTQAHRGQIGKACLSIRGVGFEATAQLAPHIRFPTDARLGRVRVANTAGRTAQAGAAAAGALA
ncbi:hypothetical protein D3C86_1355040 [compost metagenome]